MQKQEIKVGDRVRSFDNETRQTGIVGTVLAVNVTEAPMPAGQKYRFDCPRYAIKVEFHFDSSELVPAPEGYICYPPQNGTETSFGRVTNEVELV